MKLFVFLIFVRTFGKICTNSLANLALPLLVHLDQLELAKIKKKKDLKFVDIFIYALFENKENGYKFSFPLLLNIL